MERVPRRRFYAERKGPRRPARAVPSAALVRLAPVDQVAEAADAIEDRALLLAPALALRRRGVDAIGHAAERQRLQPDAAGPLQRGEENAFAAEQRRLDPA